MRKFGHNLTEFYLFLAVMLGALMLAGCGQGPSVDSRVADARARNDGPPIWVVTDYDSTLYLYGTVHLLPEDLDWQRDDMRDAFSESGTIFFEVPSDATAQLEATMLTQTLGLQPSGSRLSESLDSYQLKLLEAAGNNSGLGVAVLDSLKPWLLSEFLTVTAAANAGLSSDISADEALKNRAQRQRKNIVYLEDVETQIRLSAEQPEFVQRLLMTETLERYNALGDELLAITRAWVAGDEASLTARTVVPLSSKSFEYYTDLIVTRNQTWMGPLTRFMEDSGTGFVAVGVSHLLGEDSLQAQFAEQGYTVKRYYAFQGEPVITPVFGE